jgi:hypothetical protein
MPKVNLEILRTVEITRDERIEVEVDVPGYILADSDALYDWVEAGLEKTDSELTQATVGNWEIADESENISYDEVTRLDDND